MVATVIRLVASQDPMPGCTPLRSASAANSSRRLVKTTGLPQTSGVPAHRLLHLRHHPRRDQSGPPLIGGRRTARRQRPPQMCGDPLGEDQSLEERVRRQSVGPVYAGGGHLAAGVEADQVGGAV